jgi:hypothetical protein
VQIHLISAFPGMFEGPLSESMIQRAKAFLQMQRERVVDFNTDPARLKMLAQRITS